MTESRGDKQASSQVTEKLLDRRGAGPRLIVMCGERTQSFELPPRGRIVIGRGEDAEIRVESGSISRRHAAIDLGDGKSGATIEDLGSANGTLLEGVAIAANVAVPLRANALIEMAGVLVAFQPAARVEPKDDAAALDEVMQEVLDHVDIAARSSLSILLLGETGAGKESLASRVHRSSPRAAGPFLKVNCAALVESLLEAELFGYERGAFTGATQAKPGLLEAATKGTVFLDEVGELPLAIQAKLLRIVESGEVTRVGGINPRSVDVRFVCATNRDLAKAVAAGTFREDLYFRLDGVSIRVPALRERPAEILPLARTFVREACAEANRSPLMLTPSAIAKLSSHAWPGNVRELRNVIKRSVVFCKGSVLEAADVLVEGTGAPPTAPSAPPPAAIEPGPLPSAAARKRVELQSDREHIVRALEQCGGNQTRAAELLGISRRTLVSRLAEFDLPRPRKKAIDD